MTESRVLLSARPEWFGFAARVPDGVEVKLDWEHAADLSADQTLTDICHDYGLPPEDVVSVHLPPGMNRRYGMAAADGNIGRIAEFVHTAFGDGIDPQWLTLHSTRSFGYREQAERLGTIVEVTGYPVAVENTPDQSALYSPEDLAMLGFLAERVDQLAGVGLVVDSAHVPADRHQNAIDDAAVTRVLERMDADLHERAAKPFRDYLEERMTEIDRELPRDDPWRPTLTTLTLVGGRHVQAIHLNEPESDGVPDLQNGAADGLHEVIRYCRNHEIALVLEPEEMNHEAIETALLWIENQLQ